MKDAEDAVLKGQRKAQKKSQKKRSTTSTVAKIKKASAQYAKNVEAQEKSKKPLDFNMFSDSGKKKGGKKPDDMFGGFL